MSEGQDRTGQDRTDDAVRWNAMMKDCFSLV